MSAPMFIVKTKWGSGPASPSHYCTTWATALAVARREHLRMKDANYSDSEWLWDGMGFPTQPFGPPTQVATWVWIAASKLTTPEDVSDIEVLAA